MVDGFIKSTENSVCVGVAREAPYFRMEEKRDDAKQPQEDETALGGPVFDPPVYKQRYGVVCDVVKKMTARKVKYLNTCFYCCSLSLCVCLGRYTGCL